MAVQFCPRCGFRQGDGLLLALQDVRFCWYCWDGVATPERARELIEAAAAGRSDALRMLSELSDPRCFDLVVEGLAHADATIRAAAAGSLGSIGAPRSVPHLGKVLSDPNDRVRREAAAALADLGGSEAADALAGVVDDPAVRADAAMALAWLRDDRAFDVLLALLYEGGSAARNVFRTPAVAFAWLGDRRAIPHLTAALGALADRWDEAEPLWHLRYTAEDIVRTLLRFDDDDARRAAEEHAGSFGHPLVLQVLGIDERERWRFTYPDDADPGRTVPRWSLELGEPVSAPISDPITKFGGQPGWLGEPTWPLTKADTPMTFFAQFRLPWDEARLASLFIDIQGDNWHSDDGDAVLLVQPGEPPRRWEQRRLGPTYVSDVSDMEAYRPRLRRRFLERVPRLVEGRDPEGWDADDAETDTDSDWNKVGGTPRFLQNDETPNGAGWRFLFQFTASLIGREFADGAECYGFVSDDGRGVFLWQSH